MDLKSPACSSISILEGAGGKQRGRNTVVADLYEIRVDVVLLWTTCGILVAWLVLQMI